MTGGDADEGVRNAKTGLYLRELPHITIEYMEKVAGDPMSFICGMQSIPIVYDRNCWTIKGAADTLSGIDHVRNNYFLFAYGLVHY